MTTHIVPPPLSPTSDQLVQPVIISLPEGIGGGTQILVQHQPWGVEVSLRPVGTGTWTPAVLVGVEVQARAS